MGSGMEFEMRKRLVLAGLASEEKDKSRKGGVDAPIANLISRINCHPHFYTTSSCSGRISLFLDQPCIRSSSTAVDLERDGVIERKSKKGGDWIYVSHEAADADEVMLAVREKYDVRQKGLLVFRFEPFILALECRSLDAGQEIVTCALASGFRESGITSSGKRVIVAVRCSIRMEVPIGDEGQVLVADNYIKFLVALANKKLVANQQRIDRFLLTFREMLEGGSSHPGTKTCGGRKSLSKSTGQGRRQRTNPEVQQKLLSSLEKRQTNVLSKIVSLELLSLNTSASNGTSGCKQMELPTTKPLITSGKEKSNISFRCHMNVDHHLNDDKEEEFHRAHAMQKSDSNCAEGCQGLGQSDMCSLFAACFVVSGEPVEKLFRWGHSACSMVGSHPGYESSVIIFGGYGGPQRHARKNDLLILDTEKGSLRSVQAFGAPAPMMANTTSQVADMMVIIGGRTSPTCILNDIIVLDMKTLEWRFPMVTGSQFTPRHRHAAAVDGCNIYVYGGLNGSVALDDLHMLDTSSWTWSVIKCGGRLPCARHSHSLAAINGKLYLFGGREGNKALGDLYVLDLETYLWDWPKYAGRPPSPRFSHTMTVMGHYLAVIGGCPITKERDLILLNVRDTTWVRVQVVWPDKCLLVRHTTATIGKSLIVVGGGAACYAFGTNFSPPFCLNLTPFLADETFSIQKQQRENRHMENLNKIESNCEDQNPLTWALKLDRKVGKTAKDALKELNWLDPNRKPRLLNQGTHVAFPILGEAVSYYLEVGCTTIHGICRTQEVNSLISKSAVATELENATMKGAWSMLLGGLGGEVVKLAMPFTTKQHTSPFVMLQTAVGAVLEQSNLCQSLLEELPKRWERLGDMVVLPAGSLSSSVWSSLGEQLWRTIAESLGATRVARQAPVAATGTRDSQLQLLYGSDAWVEHRENGILYCFDATKCMFSSGNVSEKLRIANMQCQGATVVDLFAGIGYYVLPFLLKTGAQKVYACEWNRHAIKALHHNLRVNGVEDMCTVIEGDNRETAPQGVADIVCLGLLPTSEGSWATAIGALRSEGGLLLVHENVNDAEEKVWMENLLRSLRQLAMAQGRCWDISIVHVERVKWYAPHIRHLVADVCCKQAMKDRLHLAH